MIKHNLILLYRNFLRARSYFFINLSGLTAGLVCTLLIGLWVRDELAMDQFHEKSDRLFQAIEHQQYTDHIMTTSATPGLLAEALKDEVPEVEHAVTTTWVNPFTLSVGEHNVRGNGYYVSGDFFNVFSYPLAQGQASQVLEDKSSVVISRDLAVRLFGSEDVIGKTVELEHKTLFKVSGVFENIPAASSYRFDFVMSFEKFKDENEWVFQWGSNGPRTYVTLNEGSDASTVNAKIGDFIKKRNEESNVTLFLSPYADQYLYGHYEHGEQAGGRIQYVRLFSTIAVFILIIACINFMNLSTARASRRAREVGIKKSIGASRSALAVQYLSESIMTSVLSVALALAIVWLLLPQFNIITEKDITLSLGDFELWLWITGIALITGLLAGSYPALFLSGFKPVAVLKGEVRGSWGELWVRRGLVVFQFFLSVILIVSVLVIYKQIEFTQNKSLGYKKDHLVRIPIEGKVKTAPETFLTELKKVPGVINATCLGHSLSGRTNNTDRLEWEGKDPDDDMLFEIMFTSYDLEETLGVEMAEGRSFSRAFGADSARIIFNEAAIRVMGIENPIGKHVKLWDEYDLEIAGVVKDFHFQSLHDAVSPAVFVLMPQYAWNIMIRIEGGGKEQEILEALDKFYASYNPGFTFDYKFQDDEYARMYAAEQRVATLSGYFAGFAIIISCLGLFGLAAFTAERRLKEIGIRKVLGSSATGIVMLLSADFTRMVLMAIVLGIPVSYWLLWQWLQRFAFHVDLEAWYFIAAGVIALLIAWLTVASQAIRAASVNPVECLKDE